MTDSKWAPAPEPHTCVPQGPLTASEVGILRLARGKAGVRVPVRHKMDEASYRRSMVESVKPAVISLVARGLPHARFEAHSASAIPHRFYFLTDAGRSARDEVLS